MEEMDAGTLLVGIFAVSLLLGWSVPISPVEVRPATDTCVTVASQGPPYWLDLTPVAPLNATEVEEVFEP